MAFSKIEQLGLSESTQATSFLQNTAGQNLSGTISQNRMYTSDAYTLTGDLTVNDTVGLMSATGNNTNVTVMNDSSTRTITGSGTLEGGELYSSTNNLSGMTGELGTGVTLGGGVTGAPALTGLGTVTSGTYNSSIGTSATFPAGHVLQVVRHQTTGSAYVTSSGTTEAWEADGNDLHITVTAGNLVVAWINGGMINAETAVHGYWTKIRFSENGGTANQDKWTSTHIGGNFTPDLYHPGMGISASVVAAHTGLMLIKRGTDASGSTSNTAWSSEGTSYGPVHYLAMEIQV